MQKVELLEYIPNERVIGRIVEQKPVTFTFCFNDGQKATFENKDCQDMQAFLDRMNNLHELEKKLEQAKDALQSIYVSVCYCDRLRDWKKKQLFDAVQFISKLAAETHRDLSRNSPTGGKSTRTGSNTRGGN